MNAIQKILGFIGNASLRDDCRVRVRYKKLHPDAVAPFRAHPSDAGADLTAVGVEEDLKRGIVTYHTGLALEIPEGHVGLLFPRSSIYRHQVSLANAVGVVDCHYRGEVTFKFRIVQPHVSRYSVGDRVGQLIVMPYPEVTFDESDELSETDRGSGGYGSSGA